MVSLTQGKPHIFEDFLYMIPKQAQARPPLRSYRDGDIWNVRKLASRAIQKWSGLPENEFSGTGVWAYRWRPTQHLASPFSVGHPSFPPHSSRLHSLRGTLHPSQVYCEGCRVQFVHWLPFHISHDTSRMCEGSLLSLHLVIWLLLLLVPSADHGQPIPPLLAAAEV